MALLLALLAQAEFLPGDMLYRPYVADPRSPDSGTRFQFPFHKRDDLKVENDLGGQIALVRLKDGDDAFELEGEGASFSRFDVNRNWDMDGVDYRFGSALAWRRGGLAAKASLWHITSHLGDEIIEREGLKRIAYARNEVAGGVSWDFADGLRGYAEAGYGFIIGPVNRRWRWQGGLEFAEGHVYAAANWTAFQELDWEGMFTVQAGVRFRSASSSRGVRFGLEYFRGHSALTQFFRQHEQYWSFGFWINL